MPHRLGAGVQTTLEDWFYILSVAKRTEYRDLRSLEAYSDATGALGRQQQELMMIDNNVCLGDAIFAAADTGSIFEEK